MKIWNNTLCQLIICSANRIIGAFFVTLHYNLGFAKHLWLSLFQNCEVEKIN